MHLTEHSRTPCTDLSQQLISFSKPAPEQSIAKVFRQRYCRETLCVLQNLNLAPAAVQPG